MFLFHLVSILRMVGSRGSFVFVPSSPRIALFVPFDTHKIQICGPLVAMVRACIKGFLVMWWYFHILFIEEKAFCPIPILLFILHSH